MTVPGVDSTYVNNPYLYYSQYKSIPFQGGAVTTATDSTYVRPSSVSTTSEKKGMSTGTAIALIGAGVSATALIYAASKRGNGKGIIQGFKNLFSSAGDDVARAATNAADDAARAAGRAGSRAGATGTNAADDVLQELRIVMGKDGKPRYYLPGVKGNLTKNQIVEFTNNNPELIKSLKECHFKGQGGITKLNAGTFEVNGYKITFGKNGKITAMLDKNNHDVLKIYTDKNGLLNYTSLNKNQEKIANEIDDVLNAIRDNDTNYLFNPKYKFSDMKMATTIGDTTVQIERSTFGKNPRIEIKQINTLKELTPNDKEFLAYIREQRIAGNNIDELSKTGNLWKNGKLPSGYQIKSFDVTHQGNTIHVVDGKAVEIRKNGKKFTEGDIEFEAYMEQYERKVEEVIKNALKRNKIPQGAVIERIPT